MADSGLTVFTGRCTACHKLGEKYVGPALGEVLTRRPGKIIDSSSTAESTFRPCGKRSDSDVMTSTGAIREIGHDADRSLSTLRTGHLRLGRYGAGAPR